MTAADVTPVTDMQAQPDFYTDLAATLHDLAERVASLAGKGVPPATSVHFTIQPGPWEATDAEKIRVVDAIAQALLNEDGVARPLNGGRTVHHDASGTVGVISVGVFRGLDRKAGGSR